LFNDAVFNAELIAAQFNRCGMRRDDRMRKPGDVVSGIINGAKAAQCLAQ
jgi:hypothetical protein